MVCNNCGKRLKDGEKFCSICGYYNNDEKVEDKKQDNDYFEYEEIDEEEALKQGLINNETEEIEIEEFSPKSNVKPHKRIKSFKDDRFTEAFIGEDYKWIIKRPINIYALFLSWIYFLYRKMYIIGILGLALTGVIIKLFPSFLAIYIPVVMILSGILFNPIYKLIIDLRIKIIKNRNPETDDFTIEQICSKYGGVNVIVTLIIFLIFLIIMFSTYYSVSINKESSKFFEENSENQANCFSTAKSNYKLLDEYSVSGTLEEAVCMVSNSKSARLYEIYFKIKNDKTYNYLYFKNDKTSVSIEGIDAPLEALEEKNRNSSITNEEMQYLNRLLEIKRNYSKIHDESEYEEKLIKTRKNTSERSNFILTQDDILR